MLWIFPPGLILDVGIILFSVPGLEFAYSQAPSSMKTVIMAGWLLTTAVGNLIIVIIQSINLFEETVSRWPSSGYERGEGLFLVLQLPALRSADVGGCRDLYNNGRQVQVC